MAKWRLKGCPRCGGDLYLTKDEYNIWYETCLQCGHVSELKKIAEKQEPVRLPEEAVEAG